MSVIDLVHPVIQPTISRQQLRQQRTASRWQTSPVPAAAGGAGVGPASRMLGSHRLAAGRTEHPLSCHSFLLAPFYEVLHDACILFGAPNPHTAQSLPLEVLCVVVFLDTSTTSTNESIPMPAQSSVMMMRCTYNMYVRNRKTLREPHGEQKKHNQQTADSITANTPA